MVIDQTTSERSRARFSGTARSAGEPRLQLNGTRDAEHREAGEEQGRQAEGRGRDDRDRPEHRDGVARCERDAAAPASRETRERHAREGGSDRVHRRAEARERVVAGDLDDEQRARRQRGPDAEPAEHRREGEDRDDPPLRAALGQALGHRAQATGSNPQRAPSTPASNRFARRTCGLSFAVTIETIPIVR
jgi:hypothetical protein